MNIPDEQQTWKSSTKYQQTKFDSKLKGSHTMIKGDLYQDDSMYTTLSVQYTKDVFNKVPELFILFNSVWSLASQIFSNIAVTADGIMRL